MPKKTTPQENPSTKKTKPASDKKEKRQSSEQGFMHLSFFKDYLQGFLQNLLEGILEKVETSVKEKADEIIERIARKIFLVILLLMGFVFLFMGVVKLLDHLLRVPGAGFILIGSLFLLGGIFLALRHSREKD